MYEEYSLGLFGSSATRSSGSYFLGFLGPSSPSSKKIYSTLYGPWCLTRVTTHHLGRKSLRLCAMVRRLSDEGKAQNDVSS